VRLRNVETRLPMYKTLVIDGSFATGTLADIVLW